MSSKAPPKKRTSAIRRRTKVRRARLSSRPKSSFTTAVTPAPVAVATTTTLSRAPKMRMTGQACIISHSEFVRDITGSVGYVVNGLPINPGNEDIFSWLSEIAMRYEYYRFRRLIFRYEPSCPTTTSGAVYSSIDYDASDGLPLDKVNLMQNMKATRSAPYVRNAFDLVQSANAAQVRRFTLDRAPPPNSDPKMYNLGNFILATQGQAGTATIGELYVDYEVELTVPQGQSISPDSAVIYPGGSTEPTFFNGAQVLQDPKRPIIDVPGATSPNIQNVSANQFRILSPGVYTVTAQIVSSDATVSAGFNKSVPTTPTGSYVTISADGDPTTISQTSTTGGKTYTTMRWLVTYTGALVSFYPVAALGLVVIPLASILGAGTAQAFTNVRISRASAPEQGQAEPPL